MKCDGWITSAHETSEKVTAIHLPGCELCGGIECGDSGEDLKLCPACWLRVQVSLVAYQKRRRSWVTKRKYAKT